MCFNNTHKEKQNACKLQSVLGLKCIYFTFKIVIYFLRVRDNENHLPVNHLIHTCDTNVNKSFK